MYEEVKQRIRLLKGTLVTSANNAQVSSNVTQTPPVAKETTTNELIDADEEVAHYGENHKKSFRSNDRRYRNNDQYNNPNNYNEYNKYDKNQGRSKFNENFRRSRSRSSSKSRSRSRERRQNNDGKDRRNEHINWNYNENVETIEDTLITVASKVDRMVVDTAATKSVAGEFWYKNHREILDDSTKSMMKTRDEKRHFRFGNSVRYPSQFEVDIPINLGKLDSCIHVSIIKADIPLLLGLEDMQKLGFVIDTDKKTIFTKRTRETFQLEVTENNHLALPFIPMVIEKEEDVMLTEADTTKEKMKKIKKIHHIMGHPRDETLKNFYRDSSENDAMTMNMIEEVTNNCQVCRYKYRKTPPRPKVSLPVSRNFNQCVSIDLKGPFNKKYILYCVDTFSRLTRGIIIKDKNPSTIIKGLLDCWILGKGIGPGMPIKFLFDNGPEFANPQIIDLAEKFGLPLSNVTAAYSPYSNGICERNHAVVDRMMAKMMAADPSLTDQSALDYALHARNMETNNKGFSPFQIVYGENPRIPGIITSNPPSLSSNFESEDVRKHILRVQTAREAFREADTNERVKRGLKARIHGYNDEIIFPGDKVYFKENDKIEWSGPSPVLGIHGKVALVKYGNNFKRVHISKLIKEGDEFKESTPENENDDVKNKSAEDATAKDKNDDHSTQSNLREDSKDNISESDDKNANSSSNVKVEQHDEDNTFKKRRTFHIPKEKRRILIHRLEDSTSYIGEVRKVGNIEGKGFIEISLENDDICVMNLEDIFEWKYLKYSCKICSKEFDTRRGVNKHTKSHEDTGQPFSQLRSCLKKPETKTVSFDDNDPEEYFDAEDGEEVRHDDTNQDNSDDMDEFYDASGNENEEQGDDEHGETAMYSEIKETEENKVKCFEAKETNFDKFKVYKEVDYNNQKVIGSRFVLTQKPDNSIKARFVIKGFQEEHIQSDSPTISRETLKIFCSIASNERWTVEMSDVQAAFLQANNLKRKVFVQPPPERQKPGKVWQLIKPVYGLRDSSRQWFFSTVETLLQLGMEQSLNDSCLFVFRKNEKLEGLLIFHVDDYLSAGSYLFQNVVMYKLRQKYSFGKIEKDCFTFTGIEIEQNANFEISLKQNSFVESLQFQQFKTLNPNDLLNDSENKLLRQTVGQVSWLSTQTRHDLAFDALNLSTKLGQACHEDAKESNKAIKKAKKNMISLIFQKLGKQIEDLHIKVFADASLGNIEDDKLTKSTMGYFIALCNNSDRFNPIHWKSRVIDKVAQDTKTAETLALEIALDDAIYLSKFLVEIYHGNKSKYRIPIFIYDDSKSLIQSLYSTKKVKRKTMHVVISRIQQLINDKTVMDVIHVKTKDQVADTLTKKGVSNEKIMQILREGKITFLEEIGSSQYL